MSEPALRNTGHPASVLFELNQARLGYSGQTVLESVSLTVRPGEKIALVGPSGSGKSTLLSHLVSLKSTDSDLSNNIALCPQEGALVDLLSTYHNLYMGGMDRYGTLASLWNLIRPLSSARAELTQLAEDLGIGEHLWKSVDRLSGGQRQRVAIGRALFRKQPVFFGDEPVSSLDPHQAERVLALILERHETALIVLHNPVLALQHFDRIIGLDHGQILIDRPAADVSLADLEVLYKRQGLTDLAPPQNDRPSTPDLSLHSGPAACVTGKAVR